MLRRKKPNKKEHETRMRPYPYSIRTVYKVATVIMSGILRGVFRSPQLIPLYSSCSLLLAFKPPTRPNLLCKDDRTTGMCVTHLFLALLGRWLIFSIKCSSTATSTSCVLIPIRHPLFSAMSDRPVVPLHPPEWASSSKQASA